MEEALRKDLEEIKIQQAVILERIDGQKSAFERVFKKFEHQDASLKLIHNRLAAVEKHIPFVEGLKKYGIPVFVGLALAGAGIGVYAA